MIRSIPNHQPDEMRCHVFLISNYGENLVPDWKNEGIKNTNLN